MNCPKLLKMSIYSSRFRLQNVINNIQSIEREKFCDGNIVRHFCKFLPRCFCLSSQDSIQQRKYENKFFSSTSIINNKLNFQYIFPGQSSGILRRSDGKFLMHQSKRFFGDSPSSAAAADIMRAEMNTPFFFEKVVKTICHSAPVEFAQNSLLAIHSYTGIPWWGTIILVTCITQTCVSLPIALHQEYVMAKISNLEPKLDGIIRKLKREANEAVLYSKLSESRARSVYNSSVRKEWQALIVKNNCHPMKTPILALMQLSIFITISASFRNICFMQPRPTPAAIAAVAELSNEGFGWISDLTACDSYWVLPILLATSSLMNLEIRGLLRSTKPSRIQNFFLYIFRGLFVIMIPVSATLPSGLCLYWLSSSIYNFIQNFIIISPRVRRFVGIPETLGELVHPYQYLYSNFREKYSWMYNKKHG